MTRVQLCFVAGLTLLAPIYAQGGEELIDYLTQDVCIDSAGNAIAGDPANCGAHRNINIGEHSPYILTDVDHNNNGATYFAFNSIPVHATDNTLKILISKSGQGNFDSSYTYNFDAARDGYDLIDQTFNSYASIIRTSDGGCYDQIWSHDGSAASVADRAGGWILFPYAGAPSSWSPSNFADVTTYHVQITQGLSNPACVNGNSAGVTFWNAPASYTFETGKTLTAIKELHFAAADLSQQNNALELYYFTKEYGATRWEAWQPQSLCFSQNGNDAPICHPENAATYPLQGRCSVLDVSSTGVPGIDTWGGQNWIRYDCRDLTNYIALNTPQLMLDNTMAQNDGIVDINYSLTVAGQ